MRRRSTHSTPLMYTRLCTIIPVFAGKCFIWAEPETNGFWRETRGYAVDVREYRVRFTTLRNGLVSRVMSPLTTLGRKRGGCPEPFRRRATEHSRSAWISPRRSSSERADTIRSPTSTTELQHLPAMHLRVVLDRDSSRRSRRSDAGKARATLTLEGDPACRFTMRQRHRRSASSPWWGRSRRSRRLWSSAQALAPFSRDPLQGVFRSS